jgi:hypothetical protein
MMKQWYSSAFPNSYQYLMMVKKRRSVSKDTEHHQILPLYLMSSLQIWKSKNCSFQDTQARIYKIKQRYGKHIPQIIKIVDDSHQT